MLDATGLVDPVSEITLESEAEAASSSYVSFQAQFEVFLA